MNQPFTSPVISWDNQHNPKSVHFDDVYYNTHGAIEETHYVFIDGNQLYQRFLTHTRETFIVAETGFGSGLNFLLLWHTFLTFKAQHPSHSLKRLVFYSVEKYPLSAHELFDMHANAVTDPALKTLAELLQTHWPKSESQFESVKLTLLFDDVSLFPSWLKQKKVLVDAWFFDGFSPQKNPDMWSQALFDGCYQLTQSQGTFATFSAAGFVRRHLLNAGFFVNKRKGYGVKREMLVGHK